MIASFRATSDDIAIEIALASVNDVDVRLRSMSGELVSHMSLGTLSAGTHRAHMAIEGVASGAYVCEVRFGGRVEAVVVQVVR